VKNLSSTDVVTSIRIKRVCDLDLDTAGTYGWAGYDDWFDLLSNGVRTYTTDPPIGYEDHKMDFYGNPSPDWFGADE